MKRRAKQGKGYCADFDVTSLRQVPRFFLSKLGVKDLSPRDGMKNLTVVHVTLPPHYTHDPIVHRRTEEWFIILKGKGQGLVGSKTVRFKPGDVVYMPAGVPHKMGTGSDPLEILAVFTPPLDARKKGADIHVVPSPGSRAG